jgi:hypothetical protein
MADGTEKTQDPKAYLALKPNGSGSVYNIVFRGANVIIPNEKDPFRTDIAVNIDRRRASFPAPHIVREIGDISSASGLIEYSAGDFFVRPRGGNFRVGEPAELLFYKKDRQVDWSASELEKQFPPDAIFSMGKWIKGEGLVPKK